jgi:hypothetical protein
MPNFQAAEEAGVLSQAFLREWEDALAAARCRCVSRKVTDESKERVQD